MKYSLKLKLGLISMGVLMASAAMAAPPFSAKHISDDIKEISSDAYEGRGINTRAESKTIAYIEKQFKAAGLKPGGPKGQWTQDVHLRKFVVTDPHLSLTLGGQVRDLKEGTDITISSRGALSAVNFKDTQLVFVGYGITAPERGWDDFKGVDLKGKIMVVLINDADYYQPELNTFNGKAMTYYGRWTYKFEEGARRGAAGVMIIHETGPASYGWATVQSSNTRTKFDIVRPDPSKASPNLESWISYDLASQLFKASGLDLEALKVKARFKDFTPVTLGGAALNGGFGMQTSEIISHNVIAIKKGKTHPDETIAYSAHWDHLGIGQPDARGDKIFNGAVDNGSGIGALIELGRGWAKAKTPDRSVIFIAFTAEESGLLGSEYYAANPVYPLNKMVMGINMDSLNVNGRTKNLEVTGYGQSSLDDELAMVAKTQNRYITPDEVPEAGHFYRSDHFPLVKRGVPMLDASSGFDMVNGGITRGKALDEDYVTHRYHQQGDEWRSDWDYSGMIEDISLFYDIGAKFAYSHQWPHWKDGSEFKAERDKTEADRK